MALPLHRSYKEKYPYQLHTNFKSTNCHEMTNLLSHSYTEVGRFSHKYDLNGETCFSYPGRERSPTSKRKFLLPATDRGITAVDFDKEGKYLASSTRYGCVVVHDFDVLYSLVNAADDLSENENKQLCHFNVKKRLGAVKWNPFNQNQVVCASSESDQIFIYDVHHAQSQLYECHSTSSALKFNDMVLSSDYPMIFAVQDKVYGWDSRVGVEPCLQINCNEKNGLTTIELDAENKAIYTAGYTGDVYWSDIRGANNNLVKRWSASLLLCPVKNIPVNSLRMNPSSSSQLAFYLYCGWSGILDVNNNFKLTHMHRKTSSGYQAKGSWLSTTSIFMAPHKRGMWLLDFYPSRNSPLHTDSRKAPQYRITRNLHVSESTICCTAHPCYHAIVTGSQDTSLLIFSQKRESRKED